MLKLVLQLAGAASMAYIAIEVTIAAVREYQEEGRVAAAWRDATVNGGNENGVTSQEPVESPGIDRSSDRDNGAGIRSLRIDSPESRLDSRD